MGIWNKAPQQDPRAIAQLQAQIDADPVVQSFRAGYGSPNDPWTRDPKAGGRVTNPNQLSEYIKSKYGVPEGYGVSQDGQVVYANQTPLLRQLTLASLPVTIPTVLGALGVGGGGASAAAQSGGTLTNAAGPTGAYSWMYAPSAAPSLAAPALGAGTGAAIDQVIDRGTPGGGSSPPLGGVQPNDPRNLLDNVGEFFRNPRNLAGLAGIATALAARGPGGLSAEQQAAQAQANRLSAITEARMRRVDPLHQAVTQLAFGRLPVSSRNGIALGNVPLPE